MCVTSCPCLWLSLDYSRNTGKCCTLVCFLAGPGRLADLAPWEWGRSPGHYSRWSGQRHPVLWSPGVLGRASGLHLWVVAAAGAVKQQWLSLGEFLTHRRQGRLGTTIAHCFVLRADGLGRHEGNVSVAGDRGVKCHLF